MALSQQEQTMSSDRPSTLLIWQLVDSGLPTGSFAYSSGLEAAIALKQVVNVTSLKTFLISAVTQCASGQLPTVRHAQIICRQQQQQRPHKNKTLPTTTPLSSSSSSSSSVSATNMFDIPSEPLPLTLCELSEWYEATIMSTYVSSLSKQQSAQFYQTITRIFPQTRVHPIHLDHITDNDPNTINNNNNNNNNNNIDHLASNLHLPVIFGYCLSLLDCDPKIIAQIYLYTFIRNILSAAVRLSLCSSIQSQLILKELNNLIESLCNEWCEKELEETTMMGTGLIEICQHNHNTLFTRLFHS